MRELGNVIENENDVHITTVRDILGKILLIRLYSSPEETAIHPRPNAIRFLRFAHHLFNISLFENGTNVFKFIITVSDGEHVKKH